MSHLKINRLFYSLSTFLLPTFRTKSEIKKIVFILLVGLPALLISQTNTFPNSGNVGIGTLSPTEKLHVAGNILSDRLLLNDPISTYNWDTVWQSGFYQGSDAMNAPEPSHWFWGINLNHSGNNSSTRYNGQMVIRNTSDQPRMYFRSTNANGSGTWARVLHGEGIQYINGKLGIGTSNPDSELSVNGEIHAEEVRIDLSVPAPDYVFKADYDLRPLSEIREYIDRNGHLPNIPSALEMEENGVELGLMNMKLLEKIEELTLYALKQNQQIAELQKMNQRLEMLLKRIERLESINTDQE